MNVKVRAGLFPSLIALIILCSGFQASAQGYRIKVNIQGYENDTLLLGYHFGDKQYIRDSAYRSKDGFVFSGDTLLEAGMYLIVTQPGHDFFQILVDRDKQQFSIETTNEQLSESVSFKGSKINQDFDTYLDFITSKRMKADSLSQLAKSATLADVKTALEFQIKQIDQEV
ncbi:MAG TPA: DUF4369 domain-containing protein, partial [Saprospiraceae bacterium]|nr:DUF4369 domain-containing protein [Saprospiraceae bacterium]